MAIKANLGDLDDVNFNSKQPSNSDVLTFDSNLSKWVPKKAMTPVINSSNSYVIEINRWNIKNDGTNALETTSGINNALTWAASQGFNHIILPSGNYKLKIDPESFSCISIHSGMHFEMLDGCILELETNSSPWYRVFDLKGVKDVKISGGKINGDKKTHLYELGVKFVRGGINSDGSLNNNPNFIRSEVVDRLLNPGLLKAFRLWNIPGVASTKYSFYQYKDNVSSSTLVGFRANGEFAPSSPTGRGWFAPINDCNKMIFVIDITNSPLTDTQISQIRAKVDAQSYTHEWGQGIEISGSNSIEIEGVEICDFTGDAISTSWLEYRINSTDYKQEEMGSHIYIHRCNLHHCRRQGISLTSSNDVFIFNNSIHHIGKSDDGVTVDGTPPMFGIDIESMWSETNIPTWRPELNQTGLELNTRIYIYNNYIYNNARGHFVNSDGINVVLESNTFEGSNVGGVSSYSNNWYVKYLNNTFIGCELWVEGNNYVNGAVCNNSNIRLFDVKGAVIKNCQIKNGKFYGASVYGYLGKPIVNVSNNTFTFSFPHGMGNGARVCFEQWIGKVPGGISVDKYYYTVNVTSTSFQVSETLNGQPVIISDSGQPGFNISRYDYGRCYISEILLEREWGDNTTSGIDIILTGGVVNNVIVKNYGVSIRVPDNYAGRPNTIQGLTVIEGTVGLDCCQLSNGNFIRAKTSKIGGDINLGVNDVKYNRKIVLDNCLFQNVGINFDGNVLNTRSTFITSFIRKVDNDNVSVISNSYFDNSTIGLHWLTKPKAMTIVKCVFNNVAFDTNVNTKMIDNVDLNSV
ncbi:right-handed parallel beta-helix repeat-containing protein [Neobacillus sp. MER 74]|uniref:right-handed parallel beta-helix repeat-containing protein n=1 Tax=Neobacillus sp. MER 74 TaxID=2939566 RepID=UPI00203D2E86|nr:right-handed parallel beta-helix repeat-containing protein [Neobacillus sp. MER 74]MCM3115080.1 right-handed parallel beta-helix repeat-containing protein [Neobacillus sp. MER 74]